jgi:hypothetical protein
MASSFSIQIPSSLRNSLINSASTSISEILLSKQKCYDFAYREGKIANLYKMLRDEADNDLQAAIAVIEGRISEIESDAAIDEKIKKIANIALRIGLGQKIENLNKSLEMYQYQINNWGSGVEVSRAFVEQKISTLYSQRELLNNLSNDPDSLFETICENN